MAESYARQQIAFYASTPTYRPFLAYHGFEALGKELSVLARDGRFADMPAHVPDALLDAVAVSAAPAGVGAAIRARYAGDLVQASTRTRRSWRRPVGALRRWSPGSNPRN